MSDGIIRLLSQLKSLNTCWEYDDDSNCNSPAIVDNAEESRRGNTGDGVSKGVTEE